MLEGAPSGNIDCWMEAGLRGGDWREPLDLSARLLGAEALVMICQDRGAQTMTASVGSDASIDFVLRCRELAGDCEPQPRYAPHLDCITWASADTGPADRRTTVTVFALYRRPPEMGLLQSLATTAACSVGVKARLDAMQAASALKSAAFDQLPFGVVVVDTHSRPLEMNETCRNLIARGDGLSIAQGRLLCSDRAAQASLARAVSEAIKGDARPAIVRVARSGGADPYVVRAIRADRNGEAGSHCLLMIIDPDGGPPLAGDLWRAMFDLTDGELITAKSIVAGRKTGGVASNSRAREETLRAARPD
ncbi:MAG: hypothetical protein ACT4OF_08965 [Caulobacteraceae bacterium]